MEMIRHTRLLLLPLLAVATLAGCGQKGPLYLPEPPGEIVTRPATVPQSQTQAPNSAQTVDSPPAQATPAPEVVAPQTDKDRGDKDKKKAKGAATPPPQ